MPESASSKTEGRTSSKLPDDSDATLAVPPPVTLSVDRSRAFLAALWRLLAAAMAGGPVALALTANATQLDVMWQSQRMTFLALAAVGVALGVMGLVLVLSSLRWLLMSAWPAAQEIDVTDQGIDMRLGPFGRRSYAWNEVRVALEVDIDPEYVDALPDDALCVQMRHPAEAEDLFAIIQRYSGLAAESVIAVLRSHIIWRLKLATRT